MHETKQVKVMTEQKSLNKILSAKNKLNKAKYSFAHTHFLTQHKKEQVIKSKIANA